jgi:hypothetical protein
MSEGLMTKAHDNTLKNCSSRTSRVQAEQYA